MIPTAEEFIREYIREYIRDIGGREHSYEIINVEDAIEALIEFAKEAIKADRLNLLEHVKWNSISEETCFGANKDKYDFLDTDGAGDPCKGYIISINENSILYAPNIKLLCPEKKQ